MQAGQTTTLKNLLTDGDLAKEVGVLFCSCRESWRRLVRGGPSIKVSEFLSFPRSSS